MVQNLSAGEFMKESVATPLVQLLCDSNTNVQVYFLLFELIHLTHVVCLLYYVVHFPLSMFPQLPPLLAECIPHDKIKALRCRVSWISY